jgi:spermidine synthase
MQSLRRPALIALFAASGFAGLIYESIWTHYLKLFLGHAAYAQTLVLAIFMGGMAIGSWLAARRGPRVRNLLAAYALTEAAIGTLALVFHEVFVAGTSWAYGSSLLRFAAFKWSLASALILPQCVLLGMTFPLMTAGLLRRFPDRPGRSVALLYFTNSLGAAAGVLASGFWLVGAVGLPGTVRTAGAVNLCVAASVWALSRGSAGSPSATAAPAPGLRGRVFWLFLGAALITGASSFVYEVAWTRMLTLVLGASTHAFELMLGAFILGLALGGLFIQRRIDRLAQPVRALARLQIAMGLFALATLLAYGHTFDAMAWLMRTLPRTDGGYALFNLGSGAMAMAIMLPATFCAGTTLPLITFVLLERGCGESSIGAVYAANTVGAIAAVFAAVHAGLPLLGLKGLLVAGAALDLLLGILLWPRLLPALASAAAVVACVFFVHLDGYKMASGVYRYGKLMDAQEQLVFHADGKTASVDVTGNPHGQLLIKTNGKTDATMTVTKENLFSRDEATMILLAALPMSLSAQARNVAVIGFGAGLTTHTLLANPALSRVDTVEIEPAMVRGARIFRPWNERAFSDPRSRIVYDDAKTFFATQPRGYDLVISEPSNPWVSGVAGLFSDEFYAVVRRHLTPGGVFAQWIQLYEIEPELVVSVLKALEKNFTDYAVYASNDTDMIVVAKNGGALPPIPDPEVLATPAMAAHLDRAGVYNLQDIEVRHAGTRACWQGLLRSFEVPMNSDYHPVLDQGAVRARFLSSSAVGLLHFARTPLPMLEMMSRTPRPGTRTSVSDTPYFTGGSRAANAMEWRDVFLSGAVPPARASEE